MPSRHTRASSAPNTASTAPPARTPSTWVRPDGCAARLAGRLEPLLLALATCQPPLAQVGLGELAEEDPAELDAARRAARRRSGRRPGTSSAAWRSRACGCAGRRRPTSSAPSSPPSSTWPRRTRVKSVVVSFQTSKPASFATSLKPVMRQRVADAVAEPQPVEHVLDARLGVDEQVEPAALDRQLAAERVAVAPSRRRRPGAAGRCRSARCPSTSIVRWNLSAPGAVAVGLGAAVEVGLAEGDVAEHLLGEADG